MHYKAIVHLRNTLAALFPNEATQKRVVEDAGVAPGNIYFSQPPRDAWQAILQEVEKQNKMDALLRYSTIEEYSTNSDLIFCKLLWIVDQIEWEMERLYQFYEHSITNYTSDRIPNSSFEDIVDVLMALWRPAEEVTIKITALIEFAISLSKDDQVTEFVAQSLQGWLVDSQDKLRNNINQQRTTRILPQLPNLSESNCLLIVIQPSTNGHRRLSKKGYLLKVFIWDGKTARAKCIENQPLSFAEIQGRINNIRSEIIHANPRITALRMEYFLPIELLLSEGKQWQMPDRWPIPGDHLFKSVYRDEHCVVFRSWERIILERLHDYRIPWNNKWAKFPVDDPVEIDHHFEWIDEHGDYSIDGLQKLRDKLRREELRTCAGITSFPAQPQSSKNIFETLFKSGIPVIIWSRSSTAPVTAENLHRLLQSGVCWKDLPEHLHNLRLYDDDVKELVNNWMVLWDDPNRVPPQGFMTTPEYEHKAQKEYHA